MPYWHPTVALQRAGVNRPSGTSQRLIMALTVRLLPASAQEFYQLICVCALKFKEEWSIESNQGY